MGAGLKPRQMQREEGAFFVKKEDWEKAKSRLRAPLGQVDLLCDGYSVTLVNECISMFRNGIAVYVNGEIRGSWFVQDCEERRRFIPQKETSLMSRKQIAAYCYTTIRTLSQSRIFSL